MMKMIENTFFAIWKIFGKGNQKRSSDEEILVTKLDVGKSLNDVEYS